MLGACSCGGFEWGHGCPCSGHESTRSLGCFPIGIAVHDSHDISFFAAPLVQLHTAMFTLCYATHAPGYTLAPAHEIACRTYQGMHILWEHDRNMTSWLVCALNCNINIVRICS